MTVISLQIDTKWLYNVYVKHNRWQNSDVLDITQTVALPLKIRKRRFPTDQWVLSFDYICTEHIGFISVLTEQSDTILRNIAVDTHWRTISVDLTAHKEDIRNHLLTNYRCPLKILIVPLLKAVRFRIRNIRLRARTAEEKRKAEWKAAFADRIVTRLIDTRVYLRDMIFAARIVSVSVASNTIEVTCDLYSNIQTPVYLCELPPFKDFSPDRLEIVKEIKPQSDLFTVAVSRITLQYGEPYDRIYSRWLIACHRGGLLYICSHARYADEVQGGHDFPPTMPRNKKGLGAFKYNHLSSDLEELGISYMTFNIRINNFLYLTPRSDCIPFKYNGRTYYADKGKIDKYDITLRYAAKFGINVSAIILIYPELWSRDAKVGRILEHPDYERAGAYTMPNMTTLEAVNLYAAALDFLASRYNRLDGRYGRIHRWIAHNEVNSGNVWTNVGSKTAQEFMDIYIKSMRMIYYTARKYDAKAEVLISLDHFWTDHHIEPNCYPALQLLELLLDYSRAEGDFQWGIAIHPYPEDLVEPKTWFDQKATHTMNTGMVTFRNLEVLDAWVKRPETFYRRQKRTLLLSEQNPNSVDYMETALSEQAAALAYVWKKVKVCSGIDAYIAHSWIDAHFEGGLKTGLRKYADDLQDPYGPKPSWFVYRDAGTDREDKAFEFAKKIIGITDWEEINALVKTDENTDVTD